MDWKAAVRTRLGAITGDPSLDTEIVAELADDLAQRYEACRARGMDTDAAVELALEELKDADTLEAAIRRTRRHRPAAPAPPAHAPRESLVPIGLAHDIRYALRLLARSPGFSIAALLMLALGIGATTAIFSVVDAVLLKPLPYPAADRLMAVWETDRDSGTVREPAALPDLLDMQREARAFEVLGGVIADEFNLTPVAGEPERLAGIYITRDLLPMLGVSAAAGRLFTAGEHATPGGEPVLISDRLWQRAFQRDPAALGRTLRLDDRTRTVVGVVPDRADVGLLQWLSAADYARGFADRDARSRVDVWLPLPLDVEALPRQTHPLLVLGRLREGVTPAAAQDEMTALMAVLERAYPENKARGAHVEPFTRVVVGPVRPALWALLLAVGLVLLCACVNVANLLLVRGTGRLREVAVRTALGAAPGRLVRQFIVENTLLAVVAAALGIGVAWAGVQAIVALAPADVPRLSEIALDVRVITVAVAMTAGVAILFGLVPVAQTWRLDVHRALAAESSRGGSSGSRTGRTRSVLVIAEIALAVVLTVGAGLMIRSVWQLQHVDPGFRAADVMKAEFQLPESRYPRDFRKWPNFVEIHRFNAALLDTVQQLPDVEAAAIAANHPLDAGYTNSFVVVGRESEAEDWPEISLRVVSPGYFRTLGVALVQGRFLQDGDDGAAAPVLVVNEAAARRFFDRRDPLGQKIAFWGMARTIVGVVGNERIHGITEAAPPAVYAPVMQNPTNGLEVLLVRGPDAGILATAVRTAILRQDPALAVFGVEPLEVTLSESVGQRRFVMLLLTVFAAVALLLAAAGIYAVLSYDVVQRTREIGIRLALGAVPSSVTRLVVGRAARLTVIGLVVGGAASIALTRLIRGLLFEVVPGDVVTLSAVTLVLAAVALGASYLPARRAVRTDPAVALRDE
jgi:putative ABC transport system permease protein